MSQKHKVTDIIRPLAKHVQFVLVQTMFVYMIEKKSRKPKVTKYLSYIAQGIYRYDHDDKPFRVWVEVV